MPDLVGRWPVSKSRTGVRKMLSVLFFGPRDSDGIQHISRSAWFWYSLRGRWYRLKRWLRAPIRCKCGIHRIGPTSDIGIGCVECGCRPGCMDVHCLECDARLSVPMDDVAHIGKCIDLLEQWKDIRGGFSTDGGFCAEGDDQCPTR